MGLLDRPEITKEEKIHDLRTNVLQVSRKMYSKMMRQHQQLWDLIWNNSSGLTAQEVFDEYGSDAAQFFITSQTIQTMLAEVDSNYVPLVPSFPYTINEDGTVTVQHPIEEDPSSGEAAPESPIF